MAYQVVDGLDVAGIAKRLVSAGIHAIPVAKSVPESGDERVEFEGAFDDYLAALTAIGIKHALVYHFELADEDFQYGDDDDDNGDDEGNDDGKPRFSLEEVNPKLKRFRAFAGQTELLHVSAWLGYASSSERNSWGNFIAKPCQSTPKSCSGVEWRKCAKPMENKGKSRSLPD